MFRRIVGGGLKLLTVGLALGAAFWLGGKLNVPLSTTSPGSSTAEVWTCSMHPEIRRSGPGSCPICGMELIPVSQVARPSPAAGPKYACSMFCVPPLDKPGKCPVCGMDMVPVVETADGAEDSGSRITLSPRARRLAEVAVAPVERRFVNVEVRMVGKIAPDETRVRAITARVPGRLDRLFVDYTGVAVREGDHLVSLYSPELLTAQEELLQAVHASRSSSRAAFENLPSLGEEAAAAARRKLLRWGLTPTQIEEIERRGEPSDHLTIYAPLGGVVVEKHLSEGAYVETGTVIYTIADLSRVWVKLDAYESDLAMIRYGQDVAFETEAYPGETFHGRIAFIDPVLNPRTRTVKVRVNVPNPDGRLKPEFFVRAIVRSRPAADGHVMDAALAGKWISPMHPEIVKDGPGSCDVCGMALVPAESLGYASLGAADAPPLVIPATAPLLTGRRAVVYLADPREPGRYEGREVVLGTRAGSHYLVREGLAEGEQVVVRGGFLIDSAMQISAKRSMMSGESPTTEGGGAHE